MTAARRVLVIGSGFAGLSAAAAAARGGAEATLVSETLATSAACASARSGGHVIRGFAKPAADLIDALGADDATELFAASTEAVEALLSRPDAVGTGSTLCDDAGRPDGSAAEAAAIAQLTGASIARLSTSDVAERTGARGVSGGLFDPVGGFVAADALHRTLFEEAAAAGARLVVGRVARVDETGATTSEGARLQAERVVVAAGGAGATLTGAGAGAAEPARTTLYVCAVEGDAAETPSVCVEDAEPEYLWARAGELRFGVRAPELLSPDALTRRIERRLGPCRPRLREIRSDWIFKTPSGLPTLWIDGSAAGVSGFGGHGVALSCWLGGLLGGWAAGDDRAVERATRLKDLLAAA